MVESGLANAVVTGIVTGSIVALGAIGLALVYSIAEVPNFAHGELLLLGAYFALFVNKPGTVPVLGALATGPQTLTPAGTAVLFALAVGATLGVVYQLGGRAALKGSWWPGDPSPGLALAVHGLAAVVVGVVVIAGAPSVWIAMLLSALLLGALAPLQERYVFRRFRNEGATLATMLIVALGLDFVLRFGTQAVYGGRIRNYAVEGVVTVLGREFVLSAARFFDVHVTGDGVVVAVLDSATPQDPVIAVAGYGWPVVAVVLGGTAALATGAYTLRRRAVGRDVTTTFGPRLAGGLAVLVAFVVLAVGLAGRAEVPEEQVAATRISISLVRTLVVVIAVAMMASLHVLLRETKLGTAMRAASDNKDLAQITGINTDRVMMTTWIIAGVFAAVGGVMLGVLFDVVRINMGFFLLLPMFAGVILGGIGSVYGAILGSLAVGIAMDVGIYAFDIGAVYRVPVAFVVLLVVLLVKPEGIVGGR